MSHSKCQEAFYFDVKSAKCLPCHHICHQAEVRKTEILCRKLCPVEVSFDQPPVEYEHFVQAPSLEIKTQITKPSITDTEVVVIVLAGMIILWTIVMLLYLYIVPVKTWLNRTVKH